MLFVVCQPSVAFWGLPRLVDSLAKLSTLPVTPALLSLRLIGFMQLFVLLELSLGYLRNLELPTLTMEDMPVLNRG